MSNPFVLTYSKKRLHYKFIKNLFENHIIEDYGSIFKL